MANLKRRSETSRSPGAADHLDRAALLDEFESRIEAAELVAVVVHLFDTRKIQWASSPAAAPEVWLANCNVDHSATASG